jgi:parallel beta-helix repeat protein
MKVSTSTALTPDHYTRSPEGGSLIEISDDGVELDLGGAVLDGEDFAGFGVYVHDCKSVTIKNGVIKGFHYGIRAENVGKLTIRNCVVSDNHNPRDTGWLPDTDDPSDEGFGGGLYLRDVCDSLIESNQLNDNFDGILLVGSDRNTLRQNNASYNGNVGIHLVRSSHNVLEDNRADHCIRYTSRFWCDTADSAGMLLEEYSHHNRIMGNSLRYGGDGFFIRANNRHGCNHNYVAKNDGSFSPNNAFEAGFSEHNVFEDNVADFSNYGFWLGYSRHTTVLRNSVKSNRFDGVAIEQGSHNRVEENDIERNRNGVRLWRESSHNRADPFEVCVARGNRITGSRESGVLFAEGDDVLLEDNVFRGNARDVETS